MVLVEHDAIGSYSQISAAPCKTKRRVAYAGARTWLAGDSVQQCTAHTNSAQTRGEPKEPSPQWFRSRHERLACHPTNSVATREANCVVVPFRFLFWALPSSNGLPIWSSHSKLRSILELKESQVVARGICSEHSKLIAGKMCGIYEYNSEETRFQAVRILEYVRSLQSPIPCCTGGRPISS